MNSNCSQSQQTAVRAITWGSANSIHEAKVTGESDL